MDRLLQIGFQEVGEWSAEEGRLCLQLQTLPPHRRALYAFATDAKVLYVGKTAGSLAGRLKAYVAPHPTQRTNVRNRASLLELLGSGHVIRILGWIDPGLQRIGPFDLNMAAGLEDSIIEMLAPPWNGACSTVAVKHYTSTTCAITAEHDSTGVLLEEAPSAMLEVAGPIPVVATSSDELAAAKLTGTQSKPANDVTFRIRLGKTYYERGFFNVPVVFSDKFGTHGSHVDLYCGRERVHLQAFLDRKANQQSSTPRIYGRAELANWFQQRFQLDGTLQVTVLTPTSAVLT